MCKWLFRIFSTIIASLLTIVMVIGQDFIPIRLDSSYHTYWSYDFHNSNIFTEASFYYDYYDNGALKREEGPYQAYNFTYVDDTTITETEYRQPDGSWLLGTRQATTYLQGRIQTALLQTLEGQTWVNSSFDNYFYNSAGYDSLYRRQVWNNGQWEVYSERSKQYGTDNELLEEAWYYANDNGTLRYNNGKRYTYDSRLNQLTLLNLTHSVNGPSPTKLRSCIYGDDNLVDTFLICNYINSTMCENETLAIFEYQADATREADIYYWEEDEWQYHGKQVISPGPNIYSDRPDSMILYSPSSDSTFFPTSRHIYNYEDLGNGIIYYRATFSYSTMKPPFLETSHGTDEEWYSLENMVAVNAPLPIQQLKIYPNPVQIGHPIQITMPEDHSLGALQLLIFNQAGQLVSQHQFNQQMSISAPTLTGSYTLLWQQNKKTIGISRLIVQ